LNRAKSEIAMRKSNFSDWPTPSGSGARGAKSHPLRSVSQAQDLNHGVKPTEESQVRK